MPRLIAFLAVLILATGGADAAERIILDSRNLHIGFEVRALGLVPISGHFAEAHGEMTFDPREPGNSRIVVSARTASIRSSSPAIEKRLRSSAFFDAARHPLVTFESGTITVLRHGTGTVDGHLRMLDLGRPVQLQLELHGWRPNGSGTLPSRLQAAGTVRRSSWGMTSLPTVVGDDVHLNIEVRLGR